MSKRSNSIDLLKSASALFVIWLHIGTYLVRGDSIFWLYTRSVASLAVPLFFIISGYYLELSSNSRKRTIELAKLYLILCVVTLGFEYVLGIQNQASLVARIFSFRFGSVGNLWFIKSLLIYRIGYEFVARNIYLKSIGLSFAMIISLLNLAAIPRSPNSSLLYISLGIVIAMACKAKAPKLSPLLLLLVPFLLAIKSEPIAYVSVPMIISTLILFMVALSNNLKDSYLTYFNQHSLGLLVTQYFVIEIIRHYNLSDKQHTD